MLQGFSILVFKYISVISPPTTTPPPPHFSHHPKNKKTNKVKSKKIKK